MEAIRKPFQGVLNIIRFNWHFYVISLIAISVLVVTGIYLEANYKLIVLFAALMIFATTAVSLLVSLYVYDLSGLYNLSWLDEVKLQDGGSLVNIHSGFDETSELLQHKFKHANFSVFDFYDPAKHTEVSIKRARKAYPAFPLTQSINTEKIPLKDASVDIVFNIFGAHEIRKDEERIIFFKELHRILKKNGSIVVTEHLRNTSNFFAYNIGFLHFHSSSSWMNTFNKSGFKVRSKIKVTPFVTTFILEKNGASF